MQNLSFINRIDHQLRIMSVLNTGSVVGEYRLQLTLFYHNDNMGKLEFTLSGYSEPDVIKVAQNIKDEAFLMKEIDDFLCGEIE
jgi:hypothetical protein